MLYIHTNNLSTVILLLILAVAVLTDMRSHRIPNWLTGSTILAGLALQWGFVGLDGVTSGLWGVGMAMLLMLPFYLLKGMGAGDVKLVMGIGTFLGPWDTAMAIGFTLLCGTIAGLAILAWRNGAGDWAKRYWLMLRTFFTTWKPIYVPPATSEVAGQKFPYAAAIAAGTIIALWWLMHIESLLFSIQSILAG